MDFKFDKPFYSERELLKLVPVKRSTFYSWQSQWISFGNDPREMGKILIQIVLHQKDLLCFGMLHYF